MGGWGGGKAGVRLSRGTRWMQGLCTRAWLRLGAGLNSSSSFSPTASFWLADTEDQDVFLIEKALYGLK